MLCYMTHYWVCLTSIVLHLFSIVASFHHFDASKLGDIAKKASSFSIPFYSFSGQMKKETGFKTKEIYQKSVDFNQQLWQQKRDSLGVFQYKSLSVKSKIVALYSFPQIMGNGNIIALKNTLDEIPTFYEIDKKGKETEISKAIINVDRYFNYNLQKIVYTGLSNHPRYNLSTYSDLYLYDIKLKKQKRLTHKKRYFSPSFNYNNTKIIATENNHANSKIIVLNTAGEILKSIQINGFVSRPKFLNSEEYVFIKQLNHKLAIFKMNKNSLKQFQLTPWTSHTIDDLSVSNNNIYYSASYNGIDNIYSLAKHQNNYQITQLTNASIGAYQPFVKNNSLYFIEPISKGSKISCTKVKITPFTYQEPVNMDWDHQKTINFEGGSILNKIATTKHPIQTYTSIFEDLKFHDWTYSIGQQSAKATINATNLLNDFGLAASTDFLFNENNSFNITVTGSYKKWFPIYSLTTEYNYRNLDSQAIINDVKVLGTKSFNDISIEPNVTLPLSQIHGNYNSNFLANFGYQYNKRFNSYFNTNTQKLSSKDFEFSVINTQIVYNSLRRTARKTIGNKAGISINLKYSKGLNQVLNDDYISTQNHLFLPGLSKTHNSYVTLAYQQNKLRKGDVFMYARGFKTLLAKEIYKISYTYQLPLFYPDFGLYGITYFKRIRTNLFADYSKLTLFNSLKTNQNSIGFEIIFDNTFFNIGQAEISLGYRGSYLISKDIQAPNTQYSSGFVLRTTAF